MTATKRIEYFTLAYGEASSEQDATAILTSEYQGCVEGVELFQLVDVQLENLTNGFLSELQQDQLKKLLEKRFVGCNTDDPFESFVKSEYRYIPTFKSAFNRQFTAIVLELEEHLKSIKDEPDYSELMIGFFDRVDQLRDDRYLDAAETINSMKWYIHVLVLTHVQKRVSLLDRQSLSLHHTARRLLKWSIYE